MFCGKDDFGAIVELNATRWDEVRKDLSDWVVDRFVKRALGEIDDLVDAADDKSPDNSVVALRRARARLNKFLDEFELRKAARVCAKTPNPVTSDDDADDDEDENDED